MKLLKTAILMAVAIAPCAALADTLTTFVPPNDTTGGIYTTNTNDGYQNGRGVVFTMTGNYLLSSIGLYENLTNTALSYSIFLEPTSTPTSDSGATLITSGGSTVTTSGLQFIDYAISPLLLTTGNNYEIEFFFNGNGNQNFYYYNNNVTFTQGSFTNVDGTGYGNYTNTVMPSIQVGTPSVSATPEPGSLALLGTGLAGVLGVSRRRFGRTNL